MGQIDEMLTTPAISDAELLNQLRRHGVTLDQTQLTDIVSGISAAPPSGGWHSLLLDSPDEALAAALNDYLYCRAALSSPSGVEEPGTAAPRVAALRTRLKELKLDGFLVPRGDEHQGEYVPERARCLAWLTGFSGSAGFAVVLAQRAALFTDGRYTIQARVELGGSPFELAPTTQTPQVWLREQLSRGDRIGYDPRLLSAAERDRFAAVVAQAGAELVAMPFNPIDQLWAARQPAAPLSPILVHPLELAGKSSQEKRTEIAEALDADAAVLTQPDSIAWLLNIRGGDLPHTPVTLAFAILRKDGTVLLFTDRRKLVKGVREHLGTEVEVREPQAFGPALDELSGQQVRADPSWASAWIIDRLKSAGAVIVPGADPCTLPKACKNGVELEGSRRAHRRDAVAMTRFLRWLDQEAASDTLDEIAAADRLEAFRREDPLFRDLSFTTISGAGPNGAIVHYRVTPATCRRLDRDSFYLVDSGAQYPDGTTDITRTIPIGTPSAEMKDRFTRVLKGHIALATVRFPEGTSGVQLDTLARLALWQAGIDYEHGTGHGVGSFLSVHEGPQRISKHLLHQPLLPGMIVSNEPGYYKEGAYGIRIENLQVVRRCREMGIDLPGAEREMLWLRDVELRADR